MFKLAVRGFLIGVVLSAGMFVAKSAEETKQPAVKAVQNSDPKGDKSPASPLAVVPKKQDTAAQNKQPDDKTNYYTQADLEAQRRMAIAAEKLTNLTDTQIAINTTEMVLILIAIGVACWAAIEARRAAIATAETVEITKNTAERQLRAYLTIENTQFEQFDDDWIFKATWQNTGNTPALKTVTHTNWASFSSSIPADFNFTDGKLGIGNDPSVVGPQQRILSWALRIPMSLITDVRDGRAKLCIWGWAEYNDVFVGTDRRRTEFCYEITVETSATGDKHGIGMRIYGEFNGADEDCYRQPEAV